jgi:hypothetical protein
LAQEARLRCRKLKAAGRIYDRYCNSTGELILAFTYDHRAIEHIARSLLVGRLLLGEDLRVIGVSSLLFGSEVSVLRADVHLGITADTWFESDIITEARCTEEHMTNDTYRGEHISWVCPQFRAQAERYRDWKVQNARVDRKRLIVTFGADEKVRLICEGEKEEPDFGWCLGGKVEMFIGQIGDKMEPGGSIPDDVHRLFSQGWEWRRNDQ